MRRIIIVITFLLLFGTCIYLLQKMVTLSQQNNLHAAKIQSYGESSDFWLRQHLTQKYPKLTDPSVDDWTKVNLLRKIVADKTPWASYPRNFDMNKVDVYLSAPEFDVYTNRISNTLYRHGKEQKGFLCGGMAYNLKFLYQLFGYRSYAMNYGWPGNYCTHVITLFEIMHKGKRLITLQDAFLNMTVADKKGNPIDYRKLISELHNQNLDAIDVISNATGRFIFVSKVDNTFAVKLEQLGAARISESDKVITLDAPENDPAFMSKAVDCRLNCLNFIEKKTGERNILMLFLYPLGTSGEAEAEELMKETIASNLDHL